MPHSHGERWEEWPSCNSKLKKERFWWKLWNDITINYSHASGIRQLNVADSTSTLNLYTTNWDQLGSSTSISDFFSRLSKDPGKDYYHDFFVEITRKVSKTFKFNFLYANQFYNRNIVQFGSPNAGYQNILSNILVIDMTFKYESNKAIRLRRRVFLRITSRIRTREAGSQDWWNGPRAHIFLLHSSINTITITPTRPDLALPFA